MANQLRPYEKLVDYVCNKGVRGDIISHKQIEKIIKRVAGTAGYYYIIKRAQRELTKKQMRMESISGIGYRILEPNEYDYEAVKSCKTAQTLMGKALFILDNTEVNSLTSGELSQHDDLYTKVSNTETKVSSLIKSTSKMTFPIKNKKGGVKP